MINIRKDMPFRTMTINPAGDKNWWKLRKINRVSGRVKKTDIIKLIPQNAGIRTGRFRIKYIFIWIKEWISQARKTLQVKVIYAATDRNRVYSSIVGIIIAVIKSIKKDKTFDRKTEIVLSKKRSFIESKNRLYFIQVGNGTAKRDPYLFSSGNIRR